MFKKFSQRIEEILCLGGDDFEEERTKVIEDLDNAYSTYLISSADYDTLMEKLGE